VKTALAAASSLLLLPVLVIAAALGGIPQTEPSAAALTDIPPDYLALYQQAATEFAIPWPLLAAVGRVESDHGRDPASWQPNAAGAVGPMQFEPATFAAYNWASGNPHPSIDDPHDAIFATAAMLVANNGRDDPRGALYIYNHADWYVNDVLNWAAIYSSESAEPSGGLADVPIADAGPAAGAAVSYALAQLGTPYLWAGDEPGGFDCSGLAQAAYHAAGIELPRTAQEQYDAGPPVPASQPLEPGDLVFFGTDTNTVEHVGIVVNPTEMVDAPHTGAVVRVESYRWPDYLGATRPSARASAG
jgi:cell wall-associated NlpC family hydrolase